VCSSSSPWDAGDDIWKIKFIVAYYKSAARPKPLLKLAAFKKSVRHDKKKNNHKMIIAK